MRTSQQWISHFRENLTKQRIDWSQSPSITTKEKRRIIPSLQAWQLGETSDGSNLLQASARYGNFIQDEAYVEAVKLFIKEEQKHGENLGKYLDKIGERRLTYNWGDWLFRRVRYLNNSMEVWTITVIIVETFAQIYYKAIADATRCRLLKQICEDILIDEAHHIKFQRERLCLLSAGRAGLLHRVTLMVYQLFFYIIFLAVWVGHSSAFKAGGLTFIGLLKKAGRKFKAITDKVVTYHQWTKQQQTKQLIG